MVEEVKETIRELGRQFSREELDALKAKLEGAKADALWECARLAIEHYSHCVEMAIYEGEMHREGFPNAGAQALHFHSQSFACVQIVGMLMEKARGGRE